MKKTVLSLMLALCLLLSSSIALATTFTDAHGNEIELARVASYGELKMWFLDAYPAVENMNKTVDDILAKAKKNREAKRQAAKKAA